MFKPSSDERLVVSGHNEFDGQVVAFNRKIVRVAIEFLAVGRNGQMGTGRNIA